MDGILLSKTSCSLLTLQQGGNEVLMSDGRPQRARPSLATTAFGHDLLWPRPHQLWPRSIWGTFEGEGGRRGGGPNTEKVWGPKGGSPKGGGPNPEKGWGQEGWGPEGWGAQNFALFFSSPATKFVLFFPLWGSSRVFFSLSLRVSSPLSGGLLVEFWSCFGRSRPQMCLFSLSGRRVKPRHQNSTRRPPERGKKTREDTRRERAKKTPKNTTKILREDPQDREERMKMGAGEGKKSAKFWAVRRRAVRRRAVLRRAVPRRAVLRRAVRRRAVRGGRSEAGRRGSVGQNRPGPTKIGPNWPN